jgi:hypothetical protein
MRLRERVDELGDLRLVGIANDPRNTGKSNEVFRGTLGVTAGDDDTSGGILRVDFADGVAGLGIGGSRNRTGVYDYEIRRGCFRDGAATTLEQLVLKGGAVCLGGAAAELLNVEGFHREQSTAEERIYTESTEFAKSTESVMPDPPQHKRCGGRS